MRDDIAARRLQEITVDPSKAIPFAEFRREALSAPGVREADAHYVVKMSAAYDRFAEEVKYSGLDALQISERASVSRITVEALLGRDGAPTRETWEKLARVFGLSAADFIGEPIRDEDSDRL